MHSSREQARERNRQTNGDRDRNLHINIDYIATERQSQRYIGRKGKENKAAAKFKLDVQLALRSAGHARAL